MRKPSRRAASCPPFSLDRRLASLERILAPEARQDLPGFRQPPARMPLCLAPPRSKAMSSILQPANVTPRVTTNFGSTLPQSIDETLKLLKRGGYVGDRALATVLFLALRLGRPLFLEGEAGVGKTEIAKVLAATLERKLIRLQCYEGLDVSSAVYEWNYAGQMMAIRLAEAEGAGTGFDRKRIEEDIFSERFLVKRPLLQAL